MISKIVYTKFGGAMQNVSKIHFVQKQHSFL